METNTKCERCGVTYSDQAYCVCPLCSFDYFYEVNIAHDKFKREMSSVQEMNVYIDFLSPYALYCLLIQTTTCTNHLMKKLKEIDICRKIR